MTEFIRFLHDTPQFWSFIGSLLGATISTSGVLWIALVATKGLKRNDATLQFNRHYRELMRLRHVLNKEFRLELSNREKKNQNDEYESLYWWEEYFELMLFQYHFFLDGLVDRERFIEWMRWRRIDFGRNDQTGYDVCGVSYKQGWARWKANPAMKGDPFVVFLDKVHDDRSGDVRKVVRRYARRKVL